MRSTSSTCCSPPASPCRAATATRPRPRRRPHSTAARPTVTHLFNAMRPPSHRDPGIAYTALARRDVVVQAIVDGHHLAPETVLLAWHGAAGGFALVSDVVAGAPGPDGAVRLPDGDARRERDAARPVGAQPGRARRLGDRRPRRGVGDPRAGRARAPTSVASSPVLPRTWSCSTAISAFAGRSSPASSARRVDRSGTQVRIRTSVPPVRIRSGRGGPGGRRWARRRRRSARRRRASCDSRRHAARGDGRPRAGRAPSPARAASARRGR